MKLTGKIVLIYMFGSALLTALYGYSIVRREDKRLRHELEEQAHSIGVALETELIVTWQERLPRALAR